MGGSGSVLWQKVHAMRNSGQGQSPEFSPSIFLRQTPYLDSMNGYEATKVHRLTPPFNHQGFISPSRTVLIKSAT